MNQLPSPLELTEQAESGSGWSRRSILRAGGAVALAGLGGALAAGNAWSSSTPQKVTFAWSAVAFCLSPVVVAQEKGFFEKNGLQVELLNWGGSTDQLLESLATGKADVGVGLIHRWLKPLESGFDVKVIGAAHGGCLRMVGVKQAGVTDWRQLKGKIIGVSDMNSPAKNFFGIHLAKRGVDIEKDVEWRAYPADLLDIAAKKGEIHAIADGDPNIFLIEKRNKGVFTEIGNSGTGEYRTSSAASPVRVASLCVTTSRRQRRSCGRSSRRRNTLLKIRMKRPKSIPSIRPRWRWRTCGPCSEH